ncbi:MAG: EAL domain-containing protein [Acidobacteriota bacterium]|nr:EAL domain-containing protein [Acidobacteriota bacterium]
MWIYDADDLSVIAANEAARRQYELDAESLERLRVFELHPPADAERAIAYYLDGVAPSGRKRAWTHLRRNGTTFEVETMLAPLGGDLHRRLLIAEDVTERNRAERALREAKQRYTALVGDSYEAICLVDGDGKILFLSPLLHRMFGYDDEELLGRDGFALLHREDVSRVEELRRNLLARPGSTVTFECRARQKSGEWRWLEGIAVNMLDDPSIAAIVLNYRDVTDRRRSENALRHGTHAGGVDDWTFELDRDGRFTCSSPAVERMIGYKPEELIGRHFTELYFPESREKVGQFFARIVSARSGWTDLVQRLQHRDGSECFVEASGIPLFDASGELTGFRGSDRDVTSRARFEQKVRYGSRRDPLTGLANRLYFQERLAAVLASHARNARGEQTAVLFIDLDHFKLLNDTFGHAVGDNALQVIASMIRSVVSGDASGIGGADNVARVGGDEFTVFLTGIDGLAEAQRVAKAIFDAISVPLVLERNQVHVSATIGIALAPWDGDTSAALLRNAEHAMHGAKELGRGRIQHFTHEMRSQQARQLALESDLRRALERGELLLHYQPIFDAHTWELAGVEALLRWQHPSRGLLPPDEFICIAERTGQIVPVGAWVLRQACMDLQKLRNARGRDLRVSVNLSARQLQEPELLDTIRTIVEETGINPRLLELEITESVAMQNAEATLATLQALKEMGVSLAVDDFGTGYSSLLYLTRFPIDTVKVDRQFVGNVTTDPSAAAVAGAVIALAHSLELKTVAEGVETAEQRDFLLSHMCTEMQGYLFEKPVEIDVLLRERAAEAS